MDIKFKPDVRMVALTPDTLRAIADLADLWASIFNGGKIPFVITSVQDGQHCRKSEGRPCPDGRDESLHYAGRAFDFRTRTGDLLHVELVIRQFLQSHPGWQMFVEGYGKPGEHGHAEHDPASPR